MLQGPSGTTVVACKYRTGKTLGRGSFSVVKEAIHIETGDIFACKVINKKLMEGRRTMVGNEIKVLKTVSSRHPNIVTLHDYFESRHNLYLCFDLCPGGELLKVIWEQGKFYERDAARLMKKVFDGVSYIHSVGIAHRDLKPDNLLFKDGEIMIADFGLSRFMDQDKLHLLTEVCGTPGYMAPEIYRKLGHGPAVDVWALGVITYFVLAGYIPYNRARTHAEMESVVSGDYTFEPDRSWANVTDRAKDFITSCMVKNHTRRPSAEHSLEHPWLSEEVHMVTEQESEPFDLLPLVKEASYQKRTKTKFASSSSSLSHRFTTPLLDGSLGKDIQTMTEKVKELIDESDMEKLDPSELVIHFLGEHAHTALADMRDAQGKLLQQDEKPDENELDATQGAEQGDLDSKIAQMRLGRHDRNLDPLSDEPRRVKSAPPVLPDTRKTKSNK